MIQGPAAITDPPSWLSAVISMAKTRSIFGDHWRQFYVPSSYKRNRHSLARGKVEGMKPTL